MNAARPQRILERLSRASPPPWLSTIAWYYPFTLAGTLLLAAALGLLARGLVRENSYAVLLSLLALGVLALLALATRLSAGRLSPRQPHWQWDTSASLYARRAEQRTTLLSEGLRAPPFFRVHFLVSGPMRVGRNASLYLRRELSVASGAQHQLTLYFPLCGVFAARGRFSVRDVFGLTRARLGETLRRTLTILPLTLARQSPPLAEPAVGLEEKSRRRSSEEEKYYMREYLPGDRFRDINWKVSSRLAELITRISPVTQEKTTVIPVFFRHYWRPRRESLESIAHLNVVKGWLLCFLRAMKQEHPEVQFRLYSGHGVTPVESEEDIERWAAELAGLTFQAEMEGFSERLAEEEAYVFNTPFDSELPRFLASLGAARVYLFRTATAEAGSLEGVHPLPILQPPCPCLPGGWILRRERRLGAAGTARSGLAGLAPGQGLLEELPLAAALS
jgi:hypothetical protein